MKIKEYNDYMAHAQILHSLNQWRGRGGGMKGRTNDEGQIK